jgi:GT2 family glycosyltransferase
VHPISSFPILVAPPIQYATRPPNVRPRAAGKFVFVGDDKLLIHGVTYGPFRPEADGSEYHTPARVAQDFAMMAAHGINTFRTYTVPPLWLLDLAAEHGLYVLVGLPWEQHIAFLDDKERPHAIAAQVRAGVRACAGHPALLGFAVGNEIPASIVRWHGPRRVERFLERLYDAAKTEDPQALVTYVNYPSTEYLHLPFLDLVSFNVFLESPRQFNSYLARLQNRTDERPLLLTEIGLDSRRHGLQVQARTLNWQIKTAFAAGCAGTFVFAWTDEWHRGGHEILDWDFGLTDRHQRAKPALGSAQDAYAGVPFPRHVKWPRISVIVCSYNGARTIRECCEGLLRIHYPNYEVIVVDDGSQDQTAAIAGEYGFSVLRTANLGLSHARNVGLRAATGEIIAYLDDDASPDPDWLTYLAHTFMTTAHAAIGGPNIAPPGDGTIAECIAHSPGNPVHVLLSDQEAEHVPGCNLAIRKACLEAIGGFDPQFRVAGDDVDVCWRLQERGWTLGFSPAAFVWHHRRNSVRAYWKQQRGYGKAEALLERKWPAKYNAAGHLSWSGRVYGKGLRESLQWSRQRIYHGTFGSALFQSIYESSADGFWWLPLMPEWYLVTAAFAVLSLLGGIWPPLFLFLAPCALTAGLLLAQAARAAAHVPLTSASYSRRARFQRRGLIVVLHLLQPLARLVGRRWDGLQSSGRQERRIALPLPRTFSFWHEQWQSAQERLERIETDLRQSRTVVMRGCGFEGWDLEVRSGLLCSVRLLLAIEEHGAGRQLVRVRAAPCWSLGGRGMIVLFEALAGAAALGGQPVACVLLASIACFLIVRTVVESAMAMEAIVQALDGTRQKPVRTIRPRT